MMIPILRKYPGLLPFISFNFPFPHFAFFFDLRSKLFVVSKLNKIVLTCNYDTMNHDWTICKSVNNISVDRNY